MPDRKSGSFRYMTTIRRANALDVLDAIHQRNLDDQRKAEDMLMEVRQYLGTDAYYSWLDEIYGDNDEMPWRELARIATEKRDELASAECDHKLPGETCQHCAPKLPADEIPFLKG